MKSVFLATLLIFTAVTATGAEYHIDQSGNNRVKFISDAPFEDFEGVTDKIDGYVLWDGPGFPPDSNQIATGELYFEVELNGLDTGIGLRNRHMRENYLETDKFPYTHFSADLTAIKRLSDTSYTVTAQGSYYIHGQTQPLTVESTVIEIEEGFRIICRFEVNLNDFDIKIPKLMFLKIDEVIKVELDYYLKPAEEKK